MSRTAQASSSVESGAFRIAEKIAKLQLHHLCKGTLTQERVTQRNCKKGHGEYRCTVTVEAVCWT